MTAKAAVPEAVQEALREARPMPGHVFSLYLPFWSPENDWSEYEHSAMGEKAKLWALLASAGIQRKKTQRIKGQTYHMQTPAPLSQIDNDLLQGLRRRQQHLAEASGALTIEATSVSPFVTGMGEEHAVENGFAFLSPYGLPYLAGSGVKGVIRRAAEELAAGLNPDGTRGWTFARVMWLFGYEEKVGYIEQLDAELHADGDIGKEANALLKWLDERTSLFTELGSDKTHFMGALSFWDVIIDGQLDLDILTPHYGHYYQGEEAPHDAGQPQPNPFLVVAPGAQFTFHIACAEHRLPESLKGEWRNLVKAAFDHAFEWGGFGAKTAVGYGVLVKGNALQHTKTTTSNSEISSRSKGSHANSGSRWQPRPGMRANWADAGEHVTIVEVKNGKAVVKFDDGEEDEAPLSDLQPPQE